jgi:peptidylprolyl isomerase
VTQLGGRPAIRVRASLRLATLCTAALIASCGSSGAASTVGGGNRTSSENAFAKSAERGFNTGVAPTSGPLSKEPKVTPPPGPTPTKLVVKDLIVGDGPEARAGKTVTVNYVGILFHGGETFNTSWRRKEPFSFTLGSGQVMPGWDLGLVGMRVGGRRELVIPAQLAYGASGSLPAIPPNAPLVFVVDLLGV